MFLIFMLELDRTVEGCVLQKLDSQRACLPWLGFSSECGESSHPLRLGRRIRLGHPVYNSSKGATLL